MSENKIEPILSSFHFKINIKILKILNWMYKNSNIYLDRKYKKYLNLKENPKSKKY